jgi:hypothetical protein
MLSSAVLDVVIGLVFCYASVSIIASYLYETVASVLNLRAGTLLNGIKDLLNDQQLSGLAHDVYNHSLANPRSDGSTATGEKPKVLPSYIEPRSFAIALVDSLKTLPGEVADLGTKIGALPDGQIKQLLEGMYERGNREMVNLQAEIAKWFESGMERVSGSYKRRSQLFTFLIALVMAAVLNIDTFHLFRTLWEHPVNGQLAAANVAATAGEAMQNLSTLPVGWTNRKFVDPVAWCGWLVTASTVIFGASFWFSVLNRLGNIRGAGPSPSEKK